MWIIKNEKYGNYYQKEIFTKQYHFVLDQEEATKYHTKWEVNRIIKEMNNIKELKAIKVK